MSEVSRRQFVRLGITLAAGVVTGGAGCTQVEEAERSVVETPSTHMRGGLGMSQRVFVGYATRTGSTVGVAEAIGRAIAERGIEVDVKPLREQPSVEGYDAVVLGSAVNGAAWLPEAVSFVADHASALKGLPVAAFCVHSMNGGADEKQTRKRNAYLDAVRSVIAPIDEGFFLGKGPDPEDTSLIARWAFRAFGGSGEGDMRDWDKIGAWAENLQIAGRGDREWNAAQLS